MFRIRDLKNGFYQVHKKDGQAFEGTPNLLFKKAIELGIQEKELIKAVNKLEETGHDFADFGIYGTLSFIGKGKPG